MAIIILAIIFAVISVAAGIYYYLVRTDRFNPEKQIQDNYKIRILERYKYQ